MIHYDFKAEDVGVEVSGLRHVGRGKVGNDALDDHVRMLSASGPAAAPPPSSLMNWRRLTRRRYHNPERVGGLAIDHRIESQRRPASRASSCRWRRAWGHRSQPA